MKCGSCGYQAKAESPRCPRCLSAFTPEKRRRKACLTCRKRHETDRVFCPDCGHLLQAVRLQGQELARIRSASMYAGEKRIGIPQATGDVVVLDDRVEFIAAEGTGMSRMLGALGRMVGEAPEGGAACFWLGDIVSAEAGRSAGVLPALVLRLKDGRVFSFFALAGAEAVRQAVVMIDTYRKYE